MGANEAKSTIIKLKPQFNPEKNIYFGGELEKEMVETFNTFDILWYAPEDSEKLEEWAAFTNVAVLKITNEEQVFSFLNVERVYDDDYNYNFLKYKLIKTINKFKLEKIEKRKEELCKDF
jgi:hypothetical protein